MTTYNAPVTRNTLYDIEFIYEDRTLSCRLLSAGGWRGVFDADADEWHRLPVGGKWVLIQEIIKAANITFDRLITLYINDCYLHNVQYRLTSLAPAVHSYAIVFMEARNVLIARAKQSANFQEPTIDWKTWASQWCQFDNTPERINRFIDEPFEPSLQL